MELKTLDENERLEEGLQVILRVITRMKKDLREGNFGYLGY